MIRLCRQKWGAIVIHQKIDVAVDYAGYGLDAPAQPPDLTTYVLDRPEIYMHRRRPAVIICPGGGYEIVYPGEGEPVALAFNARGIHAFVLHYSVRPMRFPGALLELSNAVAWVREHAEAFQLDPDRIAVCGFSAGGHLAASLGVYWKEGFIQRFLGLDNDENRPNGLVLGYPVLNAEGMAGVVGNLLGKYPDERELELFSLDTHVSDFTPPAFLWHTCDDPGVSVQNSLRFVGALREKDIPFELHVYPHGGHGLSLANEVTASRLELISPPCQNWLEMAARFIGDL